MRRKKRMQQLPSRDALLVSFYQATSFYFPFFILSQHSRKDVMCAARFLPLVPNFHVTSCMHALILRIDLHSLSIA